MSFDYKWFVSPPRGTAGWPAVCDCGIPGHTHIFSFDFAQFNFKNPHCNYHQQFMCDVFVENYLILVCAYCRYNFIDVEERRMIFLIFTNN